MSLLVVERTLIGPPLSPSPRPPGVTLCSAKARTTLSTSKFSTARPKWSMLGGSEPASVSARSASVADTEKDLTPLARLYGHAEEPW